MLTWLRAMVDSARHGVFGEFESGVSRWCAGADYPTLWLVALIGIWATVLVLTAEQVVRGGVAWWHGRRQHGKHHPGRPHRRGDPPPPVARG
ncbi:MAG: hypothetical protein ACRDRI_16710 [Pseudonocardiaceae bacterium]